jgi:hypothetical protein
VRWIEAAHLNSWADSIGSRTSLSELVSALIRASVPEINSFRFPTGDSAQNPGYDGSLVATGTGAPPHVPDGQSAWEFGTESTYLEKANHDFDVRSKEPGSVNAVESTFVFVTPRSWKRKNPTAQEWEQEKTLKGPWKRVRVIDAIGLEAWLDDCPAVAARVAREMLPLMPETGARSTDEFCDE